MATVDLDAMLKGDEPASVFETEAWFISSDEETDGGFAVPGEGINVLPGYNGN